MLHYHLLKRGDRVLQAPATKIDGARDPQLKEVLQVERMGGPQHQAIFFSLGSCFLNFGQVL